MAGPRPLESRAARLEQELAATRKVQETLNTLREVFTAFPGLREDFAAELQLIAAGSETNGTPQKPLGVVVITRPEHDHVGPVFTIGTNRDRIESFLRSRNNKAATVEEISRVTHVPEASIRHLFSTRYPGAFEAIEVPGSRLKHWRMVQSADERTEAEEEMIREASLSGEGSPNG